MTSLSTGPGESVPRFSTGLGVAAMSGVSVGCAEVVADADGSVGDEICTISGVSIGCGEPVMEGVDPVAGSGDCVGASGEFD